LSQKEKLSASDVVHRLAKLRNFYHYKINADYHSYLARKAFLSGQTGDAGLICIKSSFFKFSADQRIALRLSLLILKSNYFKTIEVWIVLYKKPKKKLNKRMEGRRLEEELDDEWSKFMRTTPRFNKKNV